MAQEFVISKLEAAGIKVEPWMNLEHLAFSGAFNSYSEAELSVYFGWLKEQRIIVRYLETKSLKEEFVDNTGLKKHQQYERFQVFISDLLFPLLKKEINAIIDEKHALYIVSFSNLLREDHQDDIQDEVGYWLSTKRNNFREIVSKSSSDQAVYNTFYNELSDDFWKLLDQFNPRHYRIKANWVEELLSISSHKHSSARLIRAIIGKVEVLDLRDDHKQEIKQLDHKIRTNQIRFESNKMPWKRLVFMFTIIAVLVLGITWIMYLEPTKHIPKEQEETSFMQLSKEERMEIDSLIKMYNGNSLKTIQQEEDIYFQPPPTELITLNESNEGLFWNYYRNWLKHEKDQFSINFNTSSNKHKQLPNTEALSTKKGDYEGTFYNESSKSALVIVFDEMDADYMYCKFVQPKEKVTFHVNPDIEKLVVVPGGKIEQKLALDKMPFSEFNEHFFRQLNRIYSFADASEPFKLVYKDMGTNGVVLIDLKKSLSL